MEDIQGSSTKPPIHPTDSMNMQRQFDVEPKTGRVLIFQHRGLLHSGADVTSGIKLTLRTDLMYRKEPVDEHT